MSKIASLWLVLASLFTNLAYSDSKKCGLLSDGECAELVNKLFLTDANEANEIALSKCKERNRLFCNIYLLNSEIREAKYWKKSNPWNIFKPNSEILHLIKTDQFSASIDSNPEIPAEFEKYSSELSKELNSIKLITEKLVRNRVLGIGIVSGLGSSAISYSVFNEKHKTVGYFVIIDDSVFKLSPNAWATQREQTVFKTDSSKCRPLVTIDRTKGHSSGVVFLVLHEIGHLIADLEGIIPRPYDDFASGDEKKFPYMAKNWIHSGELTFRYEQTFKDRAKINFYKNASSVLSDSDAPHVYRDLYESGFSTLYSAQSPAEDFADSFAFYVHSKILGRPYSIRFERSCTQPIAKAVNKKIWKLSLDRDRFFSRLFQHRLE